MAILLTALVLLTSASPQSAPPVGPLPPSPVTTIHTVSQELVAIALPRGGSGLTWRGARPFDVRVVKPLYEADVPNTNVVVFVLLAGRPGTTTVMYGLTNGEHPKAYRAARFRISVAPRHAAARSAARRRAVIRSRYQAKLAFGIRSSVG
jgi:hypothetical protein